MQFDALTSSALQWVWNHTGACDSNFLDHAQSVLRFRRNAYPCTGLRWKLSLTEREILIAYNDQAKVLSWTYQFANHPLAELDLNIPSVCHCIDVMRSIRCQTYPATMWIIWSCIMKLCGKHLAAAAVSTAASTWTAKCISVALDLHFNFYFLAGQVHASRCTACHEL